MVNDGINNNNCNYFFICRFQEKTVAMASFGNKLALLLFCCLAVAADALEYEARGEWIPAEKQTRLFVNAVDKVLVHTRDRSTLNNGTRVPSLQCKDGITGIAAVLFNLPTCSQLFHDQNCVYCYSKGDSCCRLDLECESCVSQHHVELRNPRLLCDPYRGYSLRVVDAASCVLQFELSQSMSIVMVEVSLLVWFIGYNLCMILMAHAVYTSWIVKSREIAFAFLLSITALPMFEFYVYIQLWQVLIPFGLVYVGLCILPLSRLFTYINRSRGKKELV